MKRIAFSAFIALAIGLGFSCEKKRTENDNPNYSTATEKIGSGEGDELGTKPEDNATTDLETSTDSAEITTGAPPTPVYTSDADFVARAASGGMLEVELGKVAAQKATNADIKKFGQHMVDDHSKANTELKTLAGKKKWTLPAKMNEEHQAAYDRVTKMTGAAFDRDYMAQMVNDHTTTVGEFEQATQKATDADLKAFASKTTPTLRMHLDMARQTNDKVKNMK
jgi:putative membrane protein